MSKYDPEFVELLLKLAKDPPEAKFDNVEEMLKWLDEKTVYQRLNFGHDLD